LCENFFREVVGYPYHAMMADGIGVPTVRIETHFIAPSRLGDVLDWRLLVEKLGKTSVTFRAEAWCETALRVTVHLTLVWLSPSHRPAAWPTAIRATLLAQQETV
jgi:4-hydroxybenzoyl-CoA thioesterase